MKNKEVSFFTNEKKPKRVPINPMKLIMSIGKYTFNNPNLLFAHSIFVRESKQKQLENNVKILLEIVQSFPAELYYKYRIL